MALFNDLSSAHAHAARGLKGHHRGLGMMEFLQGDRRMAVSHGQGLIDDLFDILDVQALVRGGKRHGMSGKSRAAGAADAVHIILRDHRASHN